MTTLQILLIIAAFIGGWIGIDMLGAMARVTVPLLFNIGVGFCTAVAMYAHFVPN